LREEQERALTARSAGYVGDADLLWGQGFQESFPVFENLALPALRVEVAAVRNA
jgi:hypothetical protein